MGGFFTTLYRRQRLVTIASLAVVVALCALLMQWSGDQLMMEMTDGTVFYAALVFLMWWTMMMAMMLPSSVPALLTDAAITRKYSPAGKEAWTTAAFAAGYLLIWTAFALAASVTNIALGTIIQMTPMMAVTSKVVGILLLLLAGLYQLTSAKQACLIKCQTPFAFLPGQWRAGSSAAFERGWRHGIYCLGCCGALMILLFYGGVMEANWIGGLALYVLAEKLIPMRWRLYQFTGILLILWAAVLALSLVRT